MEKRRVTLLSEINTVIEKLESARAKLILGSRAKKRKDSDKYVQKALDIVLDVDHHWDGIMEYWKFHYWETVVSKRKKHVNTI